MRRIVVDVDAGVDDYVALLIFLHADKRSDVKIEAIICTNGNTTRENVVRNVVRLLELVGRTDVSNIITVYIVYLYCDSVTLLYSSIVYLQSMLMRRIRRNHFWQRTN
nr:unnamed protein product [Callosobruchus analis]